MTEMPTYHALAALPGGKPGPWGVPLPISYTVRDVLLYAVGIGLTDLRFVHEEHPQFVVFPTFPIRWGNKGVPIDPELIPSSPGPMDLDAERLLEILQPLPTEGTVSVKSRLLAAHPRGTGNALVEFESLVSDADGEICARMVMGAFRRGVKELGDIAAFEGSGTTASEKVPPPECAPDVVLETVIPANQAMLYRLSGDYNPLHIDPVAARSGGFDAPILHGLCTYGFCGQLLLNALCGNEAARFKKLRVRFSAPVFPGESLRVEAWHTAPGRTVFQAKVGERVVISNAYFEFTPQA